MLLWLKESVDGAHTCTRPPCPFSALPCQLASFGQHAVPAVPATCSGACVTPQSGKACATDQPCQCGAAAAADRHHHFWECPIARAVVAAIGALAGGVWGTLIGGETASLAVLGLVCALSMGLFLPGIRVWASEIRRLRAAIVLDDLATEAKVIRQRVRSLTAAKAAAESLHATVQSQLLGVAGAIGSDVPPELRALALSTLDGVVEAALPAITNQLEAAPVAEDTPLLDATALSTVWPLVDISMEVPSELPPVALTLLNSVIVEAVGNAVQHGQADAVTVEATLWPGALAITVEDDGIGVPPQARDGLGLTAIRSVASEFSLLPRPRGGTRLDLRLPFLA